MSEHLKIALEVHSDNVWALSQRKFSELRGMSRPEVKINSRLKTTIARSCFQDNWIDYNPKYLIEVNRAFILAEIVPHEIAHNITNKLHGESVGAHGPEWRNVFARMTGRDARRCVNIRAGTFEIY